MPKVVFTHPVKNVDHWMSLNSERVELFAEWGSNVVGYAIADGSNMVALTIDVQDMEAMEVSMGTAEMDKAKEAHGVLEPITMFVAQ
ncbi:MAG: hypothetical protein ACR2MM_08980 [Flavobacteriaceae bacterium]